MSGILYVVATPIGNLGDISSRAIEILRSVSLIACEDTRVTAKLLTRYRIRARTASYHEHNERRRAAELIEKLAGGHDIALVSDAGTPSISDPGYRLVHEARRLGIPIRTVPGPSAALAALAVSGLPTSSFCFLGFLPPRAAAREKAVVSLATIPHTIILFESARRAPALLELLGKRLGPRPAFLAREMTKVHEEYRYGTLTELALWARETPLRGELTLIFSGSEDPGRALHDPKKTAGSRSGKGETLGARIRELMNQGLSRREAAKRISRETGLPSRTIYNEAFRSQTSKKGTIP